MKLLNRLVTTMTLAAHASAACAQCVSDWSPLGTGTSGPYGVGVRAMQQFQNELYVGGGFASAGGVAANRIARWNGASWNTVGSGLTSTLVSNHYVNALVQFDDDGDGPNPPALVVAGSWFTHAGGVPASAIARWDGTMWSSLAGGITSEFGPSDVNSVAVFQGHLYATGMFDNDGTATDNSIARWNGVAWSNLGSGLGDFGRGYSLAVLGNFLYVGGSFTVAGGQPVSNIARWNGSAWSSIGPSPVGQINAMAVMDNGSGPALYVGGSSSPWLARWNGSSWSFPFPAGTMGWVDALYANGSHLYVGGGFTFAGGILVNRITMWNGTAWLQMGVSEFGMDDSVTAIGTFAGSVYAGGDFTFAGGHSAQSIARWACSCPADTNGDEGVDVTDLLAVIGAWGTTGSTSADINGDGAVNVTDLLAVISAWGRCT